MRLLTGWVAFAAVYVALAKSGIAQTTWYVDVNAAPPGNGSAQLPYASIQYAIAQPSTQSGDSLRVLPGTYFERIDFLGKAIVVRSANGPLATTIDGQGLGSVALFQSGEGAGSRLERFRLINGAGNALVGTSAGGGVLCVGSSPVIRECIIEACTANRGAGIAALGGAPTIEHATIRDNHALADPLGSLDGVGGGVYVLGASGTVALTDSSVSDNTSDGDGAGIYARDATLALLRVTVTDNANNGPVFQSNDPAGGGLFSAGVGSAAVVDCTFSGNTILGGAFPKGGGVAALNSVTLEHCTIDGNHSGDNIALGSGGGLFGQITAQSCSILSNVATFEGGGASGGWYDQCVFEGNCSFRGCGADGIYAQYSTVRANYGCSTATEDFGGGVRNSTLLRCVVELNTVYGHGGGALDSTLDFCEVRFNAALSAGQSLSGSGGGVEGGHAGSTRILGNLTSGDGATIPAAGGGANSAHLVQCILSDNRATETSGQARGGGAANSTLYLCQVYDNEADYGGGVESSTLKQCTLYRNRAWLQGGGAEASTLQSCIARANTPDQLNASSGTYSDIEGGFVGVGNIDLDPLFWDAFTDDFALRAGSPCIDAGDPAGWLDPDGTRADMGAIWYSANYCPSPVAYCTAKTNSQGCTPRIAYTGFPRVSGPDDFVLYAADVLDHKAGLLFWGRTAQITPFQGGTKCVATPTVRTALADSGGALPPGNCTGSYSFHFSHAYTNANALQAGDNVYAQWWSRDPASLPHTTGLTDALRFSVCP